ncbi:AI-2E family transporter [Methanobacterium alkalithermotolerans]|uniref:AI-2E family transporter n=1 Tax=Methanobacterium alkalithermotolerans TaxID=2731220 RepID=A0A8T8KCD8_9EURY|nr:AI-2E family transporter [Methanobacterium alkalithermotolerans]QUH23021.1 AI-2E family transporter [Methanobacterium alkalithermotolerans]
MFPHFQKISFSTIIPLLLVLFIISFAILTPVLSTVIFGAILAYYIRFISKKIQPYVKYESLSISLGIIILAIPLLVLFYFTFGEFLTIGGYIVEGIPRSSPDLTNSSRIGTTLRNLSPLNGASEEVLDIIQSGIIQFISFLYGQTISILSSIPALAAQIFILLFSTFYFARDGHKVIKFIKDMVPVGDREFYKKLVKSAEDVLKSIIAGNVIPAVILGILSGIIYYLLGYPYVILLAIVSGVAMFIPIIGPWIVYGLIGIVSILLGNTFQGVMVIALGWIIQTSTDFYIRPKISVKYSEVHPLVFLLGFIYGAVTMGLPGLFIGPLILGITYGALKVYRDERVKDKNNS